MTAKPTNMKKIYIAGKVTGTSIEERNEKFNNAQDFLESLGCDVVNPIQIVDPNATWREAMNICISKLIECEALYLLPCWEDSRGAKIELKLARDLGITVIRKI